MSKSSKKYALLSGKSTKEEMLMDEAEDSIYGQHSHQREEDVPYLSMDETAYNLHPPRHPSP